MFCAHGCGREKRDCVVPAFAGKGGCGVDKEKDEEDKEGRKGAGTDEGDIPEADHVVAVSEYAGRAFAPEDGVAFTGAKSAFPENPFVVLYFEEKAIYTQEYALCQAAALVALAALEAEHCEPKEDENQSGAKSEDEEQ